MEPKGLSSIPFPYELDDGPKQKPVHRRGPVPPPFFSNLRQDDIILILLILLLLAEGSECDYLLVAVLIFIFLAGFDGNAFGF
ncbi:MAG: hypothetical protein GX184_06470 [Clostridiaceae bacterium]|nr:hypothetical protein [Clostridiaceae bacterium]